VRDLAPIDDDIAVVPVAQYSDALTARAVADAEPLP
jgi:hypothetical protein